MTASPRTATSRCRRLRRRKIDSGPGRRRISGAGERGEWSDMDGRGANGVSVAAPDATCLASLSCHRARYVGESEKSWSDRGQTGPWSPGPRRNRSSPRRPKPTHIMRRSRGASVRALQIHPRPIKREGPTASSTSRTQKPALKTRQPRIAAVKRSRHLVLVRPSGEKSIRTAERGARPSAPQSDN